MNTSPSTFLQTLRERQARAVNEQRLLSGRDWLLVAACVQLLAALYPAHRYINQVLLHLQPHEPMRLPVVIGSMVLLSGVLVVFWWWARFAPYRATLSALALYLALHAGAALFAPEHVLEGIASKILILIGLVLAVRTGWLRHRPQ